MTVAHPDMNNISDMLPPEGLHDVGGGDFLTIGQAILHTARNHPDCRLQPHESVLDVGCGVGRAAIPLTQYLSSSGRYEGFDVAPAAIEHCSHKITPRFPNFRFTLADIRNTQYNPDGKIPADEYRFPYPDASFDFVLATSIFTHLVEDSAAQYLKETARVLKPGGRFLGTFFILDDVAEQLMQSGSSTIPFARAETGGHLVSVPDNPEAAVCYPEALLRALYGEAGLQVREPISWGTWSGRSVRYGGYQDQIVAMK